MCFTEKMKNIEKFESFSRALHFHHYITFCNKHNLIKFILYAQTSLILPFKIFMLYIELC